MTLLDRSAVAVPFDAHRRVIYRGQGSLKMHRLPFRDFGILERLSELRLLGDEDLIADHALVSAVVFEVLNLFKSTVV